MKCPRCGADWCDAHRGNNTPDTEAYTIIDCRDRELSNLRALLRSQTLHLESAAQILSDVLEALS